VVLCVWLFQSNSLHEAISYDVYTLLPLRLAVDRKCFVLIGPSAIKNCLHFGWGVQLLVSSRKVDYPLGIYLYTQLLRLVLFFSEFRVERIDFLVSSGLID